MLKKDLKLNKMTVNIHLVKKCRYNNNKCKIVAKGLMIHNHLV